MDPDSGYAFKAKSREDLIHHIVTYRSQNNYEPIENLDLTLDNYLCKLPINAGACRPDFPLRRGLSTTLKGGILLLKSMLYKTFATQEEADRRAETCLNCPHNTFPDKTRFVKWTDAIAKATIGKRKSKHYNELGVCDVCQCPMRCKVWYAGGLEFEKEELEKFPDFCWQKQEYEKQKIK